METTDVAGPARSAPLWFRLLAGAVVMLGYWIVLVLASVALLPAGTFPRFQLPVMVAEALLSGLLAWLTVRRRRTLLLALLIPVLLLLYLVLFNLMAPTRVAV